MDLGWHHPASFHHPAGGDRVLTLPGRQRLELPSPKHRWLEHGAADDRHSSCKIGHGEPDGPPWLHTSSCEGGPGGAPIRSPMATLSSLLVKASPRFLQGRACSHAPEAKEAEA